MTLNKIALALLFAFGIGITAGCQTAEGFGQDLQKVGEEIEEEADRS